MRGSKRAFFVVAAALTMAVGLSVLTVAQSTSWSLPNPDSSNLRKMTQITKENVSRLQQAWFYPYAGGSFSPVFANDVLYGFGRNNSAIIAIDAATGKELWVHDGLNGIQNKGMNYWQSADGSDRRLIFVVDSFINEIDAKTGKTIPTFGIDGSVDMRKGLARAEGTSARAMPASPGRIWKNTIVYGGQSGEQILTPPGDIRAYDVLTGQLKWQFHTQPLPGEFGYDTNPPDGYKYQGGANNWGEMSLDEARGIVYIPTGSSTADFWGADRHGQNLFANCLLAIDVATGKRLWHFQTVHHDLWDLDNVSAPQLVTVTHNGQKVDVVAHAGKTGFLYVFNRVTGEPLWPIEERPVGKSDVPGELAWPTQPFPTKPPAFGRQSYTEDDVNPYLLTKEEYDALRVRVRAANNGTGPQGGIFVPTKLNGDAIGMPGNQGGSNWGTTAAFPERGLVFVTNVNQVAILRINDIEDPLVAGRGGRAGAAGGRGGLNPTQVQLGLTKYTASCLACHGANLAGAIPGVPSIVDVTDRLDPEGVRVLVSEGRNNMRPILDATNEDIQAIYAYLTSMNPNAGRGGARGGRGGGAGGPLPPANVVGTGPAPHPPIPPPYSGPVFPGVGGTTGVRLWPEDTSAATTLKKRYQSGYNVMASSTKPPYTTITAYDLNTGEIKWQVPNGDDPATVDATTLKNGVCPPLREGRGNTPASGPAASGCTATGVHDTGGVGARNGMVVTSTGLLFQLGKDGWARAYDIDNGKVLWKGKVAGQTIGIPTMYESKGKQYVVFMSPPVAAGAAGGAQGGGTSAAPDNPTGPYGYIAFALP